MDKPKILTIGGTGLIGSRINELLSEKYSITNLSTKSGTDITRPESLDSIKTDTKHRILILYAAKADVDACEKDKSEGEEGEAYKVNANGVANVLAACKPSNKKLIYISTDFVFDGQNPPERGYTEEEAPNPLNWYAKTKYYGEQVVQESGVPFIIARIGYPYRKEFAAKKDFARAILTRLQNNQSVIAVTDHLMTPTFIDDIATAFDTLISQNKEGIFHVTGSQSLSPYDAALLIAQKFGLDKSLIAKTTRAEFFKSRAPRPFNLTINNDKITKLGIKMKTFEEGLNEILSTNI